MIIDPDKRTPEMKARSKGASSYRARLRKEHAIPPVKNLLRGHRAPRSKYLLRAIARAHKLGLVVTSTTGGSAREARAGTTRASPSTSGSCPGR